MRFLVMHKASSSDEAGVRPSPTLIQEMGNLIGEVAQSGALLAGDGLLPSDRRTRLRRRSGTWHLQPGPYRGEQELPAAFASIVVDSEAAGLAWAKRYGEAHGGDVDLELGQMTEAWDLGLGEKPADAKPRYLVILQSNARTEAGQPLPPANAKALAALLDESTRTGALQFHETLQPSRKAKRLLYRDNVRRVVDGPFSESKELVGGFCMLQMRSLDEILTFADRYVRILGGTLEIDVRLVGDEGSP